MGGLENSYTNEDANNNTVKISPTVGFRAAWYPGSRLRIRDYTRLEDRYYWYPKAGGTSQSWRLRTRVDIQYSLSHGLFVDNSVALLGDVEAFWNLNDDPSERYVSKLRFRAGAGYRVDYRWRLQIDTSSS